MTALSLASENQSSPFDAIRGYRADGSEYWTGRELTKWLGYKSWEYGEKAIKRAIKSLENQGQDVTSRVLVIQKPSNQGGKLSGVRMNLVTGTNYISIYLRMV